MPIQPPPHRHTPRRSLWVPSTLAAGALLLSLGCRPDKVSHYRVPKEAPASHPDHPGHEAHAVPGQGMGAPGQGTGAPDQGTGAPGGQSSAPGGPSGQGGAPAPAGQGTAPGGSPAGPGGAPGSKAPAPPAGGQASNLPAPPKPGPKGSLKWNLPKGWTQLPGDGMRFATLKSPIPGKNDATVVVLPGPAGGELANVNRWRGQIALPALDEAGLAKARTTLRTKAGALNVYDFTSDGQAKSRMVAGYISTPDGNTWFLKLTGDADPVGKAKPDFMRILESIHLD